MARYNRSSETLQDERNPNRDPISRSDQLESMLLRADQLHLQLEELQSRVDRLKKRIRVSDTKTLAVYEGNLIIEMVERLSNNHGIEAEIRGNDAEASKKELIGAAETLINKFGTAKKVNDHIMETEADIESRWQAATGLSPKHMKAVRTFEEKVEASNILAHETAGQLAQLLIEMEHFKTYDYHYLGGLIIFLYGRTVEEMAAEEDAKDAQRVEDRKEAALKYLTAREHRRGGGEGEAVPH